MPVAAWRSLGMRSDADVMVQYTQYSTAHPLQVVAWFAKMLCLAVQRLRESVAAIHVSPPPPPPATPEPEPPLEPAVAAAAPSPAPAPPSTSTQTRRVYVTALRFAVANGTAAKLIPADHAAAVTRGRPNFVFATPMWQPCDTYTRTVRQGFPALPPDSRVGSVVAGAPCKPSCSCPTVFSPRLTHTRTRTTCL